VKRLMDCFCFEAKRALADWVANHPELMLPGSVARLELGFSAPGAEEELALLATWLKEPYRDHPFELEVIITPTSMRFE
jgi:hypothetical protein